MSKTSIEWTDVTWNPVRGCTRVSEGCRNCYAETAAARNLPGMRSPTTGKPFAVRTPGGPRWTGAVELIPSRLVDPLHWRKPRRVFVNSMSDLFHEALPDESISRVFMTMGDAEAHTFQILTKRPKRMYDYITRQQEVWRRLSVKHEAAPLSNVWLGVSVEDQATADERIPLLLQTPAAVRFVSYEPALGPVHFPERWLTYSRRGAATDASRLDWIIVGGESGPGARPFNVAWARSTVKQCRAAGVPVFVKQMGSNVRDRNDQLATDRPSAYPDMWPEPECGWDDGPRGNLEEIDSGYQGAPLRIKLRCRKGGDPAEWPEDLRVREFPR